MKKGVVQLQESILVVFFIMIIIVLGMIIFYRFHLSSINSYENEYREKQLLSSLIIMPNDFGYTYMGDSMNAIDTTKLRFYNGFNYGFKKIRIEQVYPESGQVVCDKNSWVYGNCNVFIIYDNNPRNLKNVLIESRPVSLYFPLSNEYRAGKLTVSYYY